MKQVKNFHIFVEGRVQGVGFRQFTLRKAQSLHLKGWTRNLLDGRVEIKASGPVDQLEIFLQAVQKGPPFSKVKSVKSVELESEITSNFEVLEDEKFDSK